MQPGALFVVKDRVFKVDELHYNNDGWLSAIVAWCLTPLPEDEDRVWWTFGLEGGARIPSEWFVTVH